MDNIRFAVVGLGRGRAHCSDIDSTPNAELAAVCDLVPERVQLMVERHGCRGTRSFDEVIAAPDVDVVVVCTPSGMHADMAVAALRAGKHVMCEKPPDVTVAKVDEMIAAQRETGLKLQVTFQSRTKPLYRRARQVIADGRLGRLIGVHGSVHWYRAQSYFNCPGMWKGTWALDGGGSLANQGVHTVDLMQWLCGPVVEVYGKLGVFAHEIETEDKTAALLTFANGALGTLTTTTTAYPGVDTELFIHGDRGTICWGDDGLRLWRIRSETPEEETAEEAEMMALYGPKGQRQPTVSSDPYALGAFGSTSQVADMVEAIREGRAPFCSIEETRHTVEVMCAIYESARRREPVRLGPSAAGE